MGRLARLTGPSFPQGWLLGFCWGRGGGVHVLFGTENKDFTGAGQGKSAPPRTLHPVLGPRQKEDMELLEKVQRRPQNDQRTFPMGTG